MSTRKTALKCPIDTTPAPIAMEDIARILKDLTTMVATVLDIVEDLAMGTREADSVDSDYIDSD